MSFLCYRDPDGNWPRYPQDIRDHSPEWVKGQDLPEGWAEIVQTTPTPDAIEEIFLEEGAGPNGEDVRFASGCKGYVLEVSWNDSENCWEATPVLNETIVEYPEPIPREWFINGEWTTDPVGASG